MAILPPLTPVGAVVGAVLMPHAPVLVPAVGGPRCRDATATIHALREASRRLLAWRPEAVVAISPHSPRRPGAFGIWDGARLRGSLAAFGVPEVTVDLPVDRALAAAIGQQARARSVSTWTIRSEALDHGAVVPFWFLAEAGWRGPTVLLGLPAYGSAGLRDLGEAIAAVAAATGRRVAVLASGDMSHRLRPGAPAGFDPRGQVFDQEFIEHLRRGAYRELPGLDPGLQIVAGEDVMESTLVAVAAAGWDATGHEVLSYEGPFGVGYGVAILNARVPGPAR
ncbi:MAG: hypothetical protein RJA22_331 [Verrucomicrobiota bacterium]|jgi:aromatic ring-opening dioxygenase LigB subunit